MQTAYNGKIARINLTTEKIMVEELDIELINRFIGGRGLGVKMLYDEGVAAVDPLSEENKLIYITGAMTGTKTPASGHYMVVTKSPLTGMIACSNSGGKWGAKLKCAGWDAIIVEGKAKGPIYINIVGEKIKLLSAAAYIGMKSEEIDDALKKRHQNCSVLNIGPAGEHLSLLSSVINDKNYAAGRSGVGAVMGSKNLKAITVTATKPYIEAYDPDALHDITKTCMKQIKDNVVTGIGLPAYGTAMMVKMMNDTGSFPTKNWQQSYFEQADNTSGENLREQYLVKQSFCHSCPIGCGRIINLDGKIMGGPEYETLWAYGGDCGISNLDAINQANHLCYEYGLDALSTPCTIAAAMELYEKGYIKDEDCEGVPLNWGNSEAIITWTKRIGEAQLPLARLMAHGSYRLCEFYGQPEISMSVKKQEMPAFDARAIQEIGITFATSNRGGCTMRGYLISPEVLSLPAQPDRSLVEGKAAWAKNVQDLAAVIDSMGLCFYTSFALEPATYAELLNAGTGTCLTAEELLIVGERIYSLERMFNKAAGMKPEDDRLPKRMTEEPISNGPSRGQISHIAITLPQYYKLRGWENAFPTEETLKRLELN